MKMKYIREGVRDFCDNNVWLVAFVAVTAFICLIHFSGFGAWHHHLVDEFWKHKHF